MSLLLLLPNATAASPEAVGAATLQPFTTQALGYHLHPAGVGSTVGAVQFNAAADALRHDDAQEPASPSSYTLTFWVRPQTGAGDPSIWYDADSSGTDLMVGANSGVASIINGNGFATIATVGSTLSNNTWYFVALRISVTTATISLGTESTSVSHASGTCPAQGANYRAWFGGTASSYYPTADMCLIRQWDGVLSDAQIEAERTSATPVVTSGLFGDWRLASDATKLTNSSTGGNLVAAGAGPWADVTGPSVGAAITEAVGQVTLSAFTSSATGTFTSAGVTGSAAITLGAFSSTATGTAGSVDVTGSASVNLASFTSTATANRGNTSSASTTLSAFTSTATAIATNSGPLDWTGLMPLISRGKPIYGTGTPAQMNDGYYGYVDGSAEGAWSCTAGSWVAINVGAGASQVLVGISNDNAGGGSYLSSVIQAYRLQVSNDSTNGSNGNWTTVVTVTGNPAYAREHKFNFAGYSWVKLLVDTCSGGQLDELNIWDASYGTPDTFAFLGDSITDGALRRHFYFGGGLLPSFQENVLENQPGHYPLQLNVGVTGQGASYWATNIASALSLYPDVKHWCINLGMNDGASMPSQLSQWRTDMTTVVNAIVAAGRIPIIARTTYTGSAGYGGGNYDTCQLRYLNDNGVDWVVSNLGVRAGPDLFALFYANASTYAVTSDPHPNEAGYKAWTNAWADNLGIADANYRHGFAEVTLSAFTSSATGTAEAPAITSSAAVTLGAFTSTATANVGATTSATASMAAFTSTSTATANVGASCTSTASLGAFTSTATGIAGTFTVTGSASVLLETFTSTASANAGASGSASTTLGAFSSTATGTATSSTAAGSAAVALSAFMASASAVVGSSGSGAVALSPFTVSATAIFADIDSVFGLGASTLSPFTTQGWIAATSVISFMRDVELDIATILGAQTSVTLGHDLFAGPVPVSPPDRYVVVRFTTGERDGVIGEAEGGDVTYRNTVQVLIRGERNRYSDTLTLAKTLFTALTHPNQDVYLYCAPSSAAPAYIGPDENGRHRFSFDVECEYSATIGEGAIVAMSPTGNLDLNGVILRSPNGTRYRVSVGNGGSLTTTQES